MKPICSQINTCIMSNLSASMLPLNKRRQRAADEVGRGGASTAAVKQVPLVFALCKRSIASSPQFRDRHCARTPSRGVASSQGAVAAHGQARADSLAQCS
jgi:hypothetical protein